MAIRSSAKLTPAKKGRRTGTSMIEEAGNLLLLTHQNPDIDGAGAVAALAITLRSAGKHVVALNAEPVPNLVAELAPKDVFVDTLPTGFSPQAIVIIDTSELQHLASNSKLALESFRSAPILNIDHHLTNPRFGAVNVVNPDASSSSELVYQLIKRASWMLTPSAASLLLAGILADTGRFRYAYTSAATMLASSDLMKAGANLFDINERAEKVFTLTDIQFWGELLRRATPLLEGRILWTEVSLVEVSHIPHPAQVISSELFNFFLRSRDCQLVILFEEEPNGRVRVHLRSSGMVDCTVVARNFGGGGHVRAAGCRIAGHMSDAREAVLSFVNQRIAELTP